MRARVLKGVLIGCLVALLLVGVPLLTFVGLGGSLKPEDGAAVALGAMFIVVLTVVVTLVSYTL